MNVAADMDEYRLIVEALPQGAALVDARQDGLPVLYVNPAFERLTGYTRDELTGRNLRVLHSEAPNQPGLLRLREAIRTGAEGRFVVQNFRKGGESFWMDVQLLPLRDAEGRLTHWLSLHAEAEARGAVDDRAATGRFRAMTPEALQRMDPLTGLRTRSAFEELLGHRLELAAREGGRLTLFLAQVDDFDRYVDTFDRAAGDALLKRVAFALGTCFRRGSDVLGRHDDAVFAALAATMPDERVGAHAREACTRVGDLRIHHPRSRYRRHVTLSIGAVGGAPPPGTTAETLLRVASEQLEAARAEGDTVRAMAWGPPAA